MIPIGTSDPSTTGGRTSSQHDGTLLALSSIACIAEASLCSHVHARTDANDSLSINSINQTASDDSSDECLHDVPPNLVGDQGSDVGALQRCHSEVIQRTRSAWSTRWSQHCEGIDSEVFKPTLSSDAVKIHKKISEGGSSEVFRGRLRWQRCDKQGTTQVCQGAKVRKYRVAIKVLHQNRKGKALKQAADDLKAEAAILSLFENANIIKCYGTCHVDRGGAGQAGSAAPAPSLVLECMHSSLEEYLCTAYPTWLVSSGSCSREHLLLLMVHLLEAVAAIADRSLIHRDIKPANCLLSADYRMMKIADFGLCRPARACHPFLRAPSHERTGCGTARPPSPECLSLTGELGSYRYMAPEIFMNQVRLRMNMRLLIYPLTNLCMFLRLKALETHVNTTHRWAATGARQTSFRRPW